MDSIQKVRLVPCVLIAWTLPRASMMPVNIFANLCLELQFYKFYGIFAALKEVLYMLIIDSKDCENIDKALKKYKKKFEKAKILVQLRERQSYTKPSVRRRGEVLKAVYKQQVATGKFE